VVAHALAHRRTATIDRYPPTEWLINSSIFIMVGRVAMSARLPERHD
jgi:hypothetical protein